MSASASKVEIRKEFREVVNMSPSELEEWLETDQSQAVGWFRDGESESVGHQSGRRIVGIQRKDAVELDQGDYAHMRKVIGYVRRHLAQEPENVVTSRWRYSLMNWGHDPLKD